MTAPTIITCFCGSRIPAALIHCDRCSVRNGKAAHHAPEYLHEGQCRFPGCDKPAENFRGKYGLWCKVHAEQATGRTDADAIYVNGKWTPEAVALSGELAALMPKPAEPTVYPHRPFTVGVLDRTEIESSSRPGFMYQMALMVGHGWVHLTADCQGWNERGHCKHADELNERMK